MARVYFILFFVLTLGSLSAQDHNNLALDVFVRDLDGGKLVGAKISIIEDGILVGNETTGKNGRFDVLLDFDHEYTIVVAKAGYESKRISVNTRNVPLDEQVWGYEQAAKMDLFKQIEAVDFSILEKPVAKLYYDPNAQNFVFDQTYIRQIKSQIDDLIEDYEKKEKMQEQILKQKERDYQLAISDAENAMEDGDLLAAKENYLAASSIKPNEKTPKSKIAEIDKKLNAEANTEEKYMSVLATADQLFAVAKYSEAKGKYEEASKLKPAESYPKNRIKECAEKAKVAKAEAEAEAKLAEADRNYNEQIEKGDNELKAENYANAKTYYQNALGYKSEEKYPKEQLEAIAAKLKAIDESKKLAAEQAITDEKYNAQIAKADAAFKSGNYTTAKPAYEAAQNIKTNETYPAEQLALIEAKLKEASEKEAAVAAQQQKDAAYQKLISSADDKFGAKKYDEAIAEFEQALEMKPSEEYPKTQIEKIKAEKSAQAEKENLLAEKEKIDREYKALVDAADKLLAGKLYTDAKLKYQEASKIKPAEDYPQAQIAKLNNLITAQAEQEAFQLLISQADAAFEAQKLDNAKELYQQALQSQPTEKHPRNRIAEIDRLIAAKQSEAEAAEMAAEQKKKYDEAVRTADETFNKGDFKASIPQYSAAQNIKPDEEYPSQQIQLANQKIKEAETAMEEQEALAKIEEDYKVSIAKADEQRDKELFDDAIVTYNLAASIKPDEEYPKNQIDAIRQIQAERKQRDAAAALEAENKEKKAALQERYESYVTSADGYMNSEDYLRARSEYEKAKATKPEKAYPQEQIEAINKLLSELDAQSKLEEEQRTQYNNLLAKGDRAVASKEWEEARSAYNAALEIYPDEEIPKAQQETIDELEEKQKQDEIDAQFADLISAADKHFLTKDYEEALSEYNQALELKPENDHAKLRINKIEELLNADTETTNVKKDDTRSVTEENFNEGNAKVTIRTVKIGDKTDVYKRVVHSWGGKYYFLNDLPISELVWNRDTTE